MGKEDHFKDPRTGEDLTAIFWGSAGRWPQLRQFLRGLKLKNPRPSTYSAGQLR